MNSCVLICDDDKDILEVTKIILQEKGFRVETLTNLTETTFLDKVLNINPDLILMDLWIPEMGGIKATEILKSNSQSEDIPVILFSANNDIEKVARHSGAQGFISKPYDITFLENTIKKHIRRASQTEVA